LVITGFDQAWFTAIPYRKDDFEVVQLQDSSFTIRNNHREQERGSWVAINWQAEGTRRLAGSRSKQDQLVALVKNRGGRITRDMRPDGGFIIGIDLHKSRVIDDDLNLFAGLTTLRSLNLYGTGISDAGLSRLTGLTGLRTLHLSDTAVTDIGLQYVSRMTGLEELGLNNTRVTDEGLHYLKSLSTLHTLALSGPQITDRGLAHLRRLNNLKQLSLAKTGVTDAGIQDFRKALPRVTVIR
jgi:hypothetical protein